MVELLAPAGTYDSFLAALNAGADAIYLGGEKYSARAYADNFTSEQIVQAIRIAHLHDCKIYLTLNTLIKENEISDIVDYIKPFYLAGLDGVIVQDFGVVHILKTVFSQMEIHASTQMTITGSDGAKLAKDYGFSRIVPARELSLQEIKQIKKEVDIEIECFIHGAMCYGYSGQCLFSSILGGRSGNRGRCAGPCRLPYHVRAKDVPYTSKEEYPISMKDMCVLHILPSLIEAGIDSFKIEGRMKSPAYAAGVTALYRKYIDLYYEKGAKEYRVADEDIETLMHLYIRSEISDGYYNRHNDTDMITLQKPSYLGSDDSLVSKLLNQYVKEPSKVAVCIDLSLHLNENAVISIMLAETNQTEKICVQLTGDMVQLASKRPVTKEQVEDAVVKLGNTSLECLKFTLDMDEQIFVPVGKLKELRRSAVALFEEKLLQIKGYTLREFDEVEPDTYKEQAEPPFGKAGKELHVSCMTLEQLECVIQLSPNRIYVDADLLMVHTEKVFSLMNEAELDFYISLPYIKRQRDENYYASLVDLIRDNNKIKGILLHTIDQVSYACSIKEESPIILVADSSLYVWNHLAYYFLSAYVDEITLPYELNFSESRALSDTLAKSSAKVSQIVYSTIPMLISANCVLKTKNKCKGNTCLSKGQYLEDRYQIKFPVYNNCNHCYNVIYNSVPLSLHNKWKQVSKMKVSAYRIDFVFESGQECFDIVNLYDQKMNGKQSEIIFKDGEYTTGHFGREVE